MQGSTAIVTGATCWSAVSVTVLSKSITLSFDSSEGYEIFGEAANLVVAGAEEGVDALLELSDANCRRPATLVEVGCDLRLRSGREEGAEATVEFGR